MARTHLAITRDEDEIPDARDNCRDEFNPSQEDANGNGIGDSCDIIVPQVDRSGVYGEGDKEVLHVCRVRDHLRGRQRHPNLRHGDKLAAGVTVTVAGKDAHGDLINRTVRTDARGRFAVTVLLPGLYDMKLDAAPSAVKVGQVSHGAAGSSAGKAAPSGVTGITLSGFGSTSGGYELALAAGMPKTAANALIAPTSRATPGPSTRVSSTMSLAPRGNEPFRRPGWLAGALIAAVVLAMGAAAALWVRRRRTP